MQRSGPRTPAQDTSKQQLHDQQLQQKQKKRLSFRDPEVEGPQKNSNSFFGGCKSKTLARTTSSRPKIAITKKLSSSFEDLTSEDQIRRTAQQEGNALSDLYLVDGDQNHFLDSLDKETDILDNSPPQDIPRYQPHFKISREDQEFLDDLVSPLQDSPTMRGPSTEDQNEIFSENCIPMEPYHQESRSSSSDQHQILMLRYQLDQQNQQTQMAVHQIQLLRDQMSAESEARRKAQEQNNELMQQNTELLSHMEKLFSQIEELEKQVQSLEQEKRGRRSISAHQTQASQRQPISYAAHRRQSTEQTIQNRLSFTATKSAERYKPAFQNRSSYSAAKTVEQDKSATQSHLSYPSSRTGEQEKPVAQSRLSYTSSRTVEQDKPAVQSRLSFPPVRNAEQEKPAVQSRSSYTAARKNSLTLTKPIAMISKSSTTQNTSHNNSTSANTGKKITTLQQKSYGIQNKVSEPGTKPKDTLRIDLSPSVQNSIKSPFNTAWRTKSPESNPSNIDKNQGNSGGRSQAGSLSSYGKKSQDSLMVKSPLFGSGSTLSSTGATQKKYSSSTSDLYSSPSTYQSKSSLAIEESTTGVRNAVSNLSINSTTASKLPRYQPFTGWQRRTSLTNDCEPISGLGKETYKNTSLFNR